MGATARLRFFRLADKGVHCDESGCFVGEVALLRRSPVGANWAARSFDDLDEDLSALYGWPIDSAAKRGGLAAVAGALQRGEMALAKIAALLLRFPDPPALAKDRGTSDLAERLFESGLLKDGWDPAQHPRTGEAPNPGQFAVKPKAPETERAVLTTPKGGWRGLGAVVAEAMKKARALLKSAATELVETAVETGGVTVRLNPEVNIAIRALIETLELLNPTELNANEQQAIDQVRAATDAPKTLEALHQPPTENRLGYELHHIVEQNDDNVAKSPAPILVGKFGRPAIDDPDNLVWVPRLKHERITALYNSKAAGDTAGRLYRQIVNGMDYPSQRAAGLAALRLLGVLQ